MSKSMAGKFFLLVLAFALLAAVGCGSVSNGRSLSIAATPTPTPVSTPTPGPSPTPTPIPTPTPGPSPTPSPFPTPTPGPSPTPTPFPTPTPVPTSTFVFVGNNPSGGVTVFKLGSDGSLTEVPGAGITGNLHASALAQSGQLLLSAQAADDGVPGQINLYSIHPQTGALLLKATAGAMLPTLSASGGLAAAMNDEFAYIGTANGIYAFSLANGNLTPIKGSPFHTGSAALNLLKIDGAFLLAAHGPSSAVQSFQIAGNGALMPAGNNQNSGAFSAFAAKISAQQALSNLAAHLTATGVAEDPAGRFLVGTFGDETGESIMAFKVDATTRAVTKLPNSHPVGSTRPTDIVAVTF